MADGQQGQGGQQQQQQQFNANDYYLKQQAARMLSAIQKGYNENFQNPQGQVPVSMTMTTNTSQPAQVSLYMNQPQNNQQQPQQQQQQQQQQAQQQQNQQQQAQQQQQQGSSHQIQVQHQQLQHQLQQVQQAQQQFQQMQHLAQMQQQFQQQYNPNTNANAAGATAGQISQAFSPTRRGRKPNEKRKRKRHTYVKRPTTAYLYFVSKYRETLKEAGEVVPKAKIITQACAEKWRGMTEEEKEPFLELSRRDRVRWQTDKALEKKPRDPNRPKRPPSAYFLFLADFRKSYPNKTDPAKEITKKAGTSWNSLTDQEKTPYYRNAQVERAKWEIDLEAYKSTRKPGMQQAAQIQQQAAQLQQQQQQEDVSAVATSSSDTTTNNLLQQQVQGSAGLLGGSISAVTTPHSPTSNSVLASSITQASQQQQAPVYVYQNQLIGNSVPGNSLHFIQQDEFLTGHSHSESNDLND